MNLAFFETAINLGQKATLAWDAIRNPTRARSRQYIKDIDRLLASPDRNGTLIVGVTTGYGDKTYSIGIDYDLGSVPQRIHLGEYSRILRIALEKNDRERMHEVHQLLVSAAQLRGRII